MLWSLIAKTIVARLYNSMVAKTIADSLIAKTIANSKDMEFYSDIETWQTYGISDPLQRSRQQVLACRSLPAGVEEDNLAGLLLCTCGRTAAGLWRRTGG
jgi:hypothetical protein